MHKTDRQTTLRRAVSCQGIGLHTGLLVNMTLKPAPADFGVVFLRRDLRGSNSVRASHANLTDTTLATYLGNGRVLVQTVEHLLSALAGCGVDNALVELDAPEVPIMDGSALPFIHLVRNAGLRAQRRPRTYLKVTRPVLVEDGDKHASLSPADRISVSCEIEFDHPMIGRQRVEYRDDDHSFAREIAPARTFGFAREVAWLQSRGLARGGSLDNAVVLSPEGLLNGEGLRFHDEFARHKALDAIGDLSLVGHRIIGRLVSHKSGHALNARLVEALLETPDAWELVTREEYLADEFPTGALCLTAPQLPA